MLSRALADAAHYPAIDLAGSVSRVAQNIVPSEQLKVANRFRRLWTLYQQSQDLIQVGAYQPGTNPDLDEAIRLRQKLEVFLRQEMDVRADYQGTLADLGRVMGI
jgi:flagellum-specific ATP synthase